MKAKLVFERALRFLRFTIFTPPLPHGRPDFPVRTLGAGDGRKSMLLSPHWHDPVLVSGGVGEDIAFEIEFASLCGGNVYLVDPTERSALHVEAVVARIGASPLRKQSRAGVVPPEEYQLQNVRPAQLQYRKSALWGSSGKLKLWPPKNSDEYSYSVRALGLGRKSVRNATPIFVDCISIGNVCSLFNLPKIDVLKLDIEGAALEVLSGSFREGIFPDQILLEIDELLFPGLNSRKRARQIIKLLTEMGYLCVDSGNGFEFSFAHEKFLTSNFQV